MNMKFTEAQFVEAVEMLQSMEFVTSGRKNKRRANRTEIRIPVDIKMGQDSQSPWKVVQMHDISARGIKLESDQAIQPGDSFLLRLPTKADKKSDAPLICRAAHCTPNKKSFVIGAEFIGRQTQEAPSTNADDELSRIQRSILG
jgi:hypothetical protein